MPFNRWRIQFSPRLFVGAACPQLRGPLSMIKFSCAFSQVQRMLRAVMWMSRHVDVKGCGC
eukprot:3589862-Pyramimonas_sp.AAC.2